MVPLVMLPKRVINGFLSWNGIEGNSHALLDQEKNNNKKSNANANLEFFNKLDGEPEKTCNVTLLFNMKTMLICDCVSRPGLCKASLSSAEVWVPVLE